MKRSIIQEDPHGIAVRLAASSSDLVKGITPGPMPPLYGYDLTGRKDSPLIEVPMVAGPKRDPILAIGRRGWEKRRCIRAMRSTGGMPIGSAVICMRNSGRSFAQSFAFAVFQRF